MLGLIMCVLMTLNIRTKSSLSPKFVDRNPFTGYPIITPVEPTKKVIHLLYSQYGRTEYTLVGVYENKEEANVPLLKGCFRWKEVPLNSILDKEPFPNDVY